jgi:hypothetical protein
MEPRKVFNWLIALCVATALLAAPLSAPAMAALHAGAAANEMQANEMQANEMQAMADDMPCCPDQQDQKAKDCGSCPFIALCMLTITMPAPHGAGVLIDRDFSRRAFALPDDLLIDGLGEHPPDHPPRIIV